MFGCVRCNCFNNNENFSVSELTDHLLTNYKCSGVGGHLVELVERVKPLL